MNFLCQASFAIKGYNFADNKLNVRVGPDNGWLRAEMNGFIPESYTMCVRFYPKFMRFGDQLGLWNIYTSYDLKKPPKSHIFCGSTGQCKSNPIVVLPKLTAYPKTNIVRKWSTLCVGIDFIDDNIFISYNGKIYDNTKREEQRKKDKIKTASNFPVGYFSGK